MASRFLIGKGELKVDCLTPVIRTLFAPFLYRRVDGSVMTKAGNIKIFLTVHDRRPSWNSLTVAVNQLGQSLNPEFSTSSFLKESFLLLQQSLFPNGDESHQNDSRPSLKERLNAIYLDKEIHFSDLFEIACHLDDGHGLSTLIFSGQDLDGYDATAYIDRNIESYSSAQSAITLGPMYSRLLDDSDINLKHIAAQISTETILTQIKDLNIRNEVRYHTGQFLISESKMNRDNHYPYEDNPIHPLIHLSSLHLDQASRQFLTDISNTKDAFDHGLEVYQLNSDKFLVQIHLNEATKPYFESNHNEIPQPVRDAILNAFKVKVDFMLFDSNGEITNSLQQF